VIDLAKGRRVSGGSINEAYAVPLDDGRTAFVKTRPDAPPGEYAAEAAALAWLAEPGTIRIPEVIEVDETYLALEWVEPGALDAAGEEELGRGLAGLHAAGADAFGAERLHIGPLTFDAAPADDWPTFYAERLVRPLAQRVSCSAALRVCDRIHDFAGPDEPPARLHGDLWSGNVHAGADGHPWLVDPVAYGGHREVDLAMLELFGAPSRRTMAAYEEVAPLAGGRRDRVALYQLFPLLVHAVLFGGSYGASAEAAARRYVG
jgi:fructosamine-3-kinase